MWKCKSCNDKVILVEDEVLSSGYEIDKQGKKVTVSFLDRYVGSQGEYYGCISCGERTEMDGDITEIATWAEDPLELFREIMGTQKQDD